MHTGTITTDTTLLEQPVLASKTASSPPIVTISNKSYTTSKKIKRLQHEKLNLHHDKINGRLFSHKNIIGEQKPSLFYILLQI
jgi:hypothetical protein